jgi:hypothetical protein
MRVATARPSPPRRGPATAVGRCPEPPGSRDLPTPHLRPPPGQVTIGIYAFLKQEQGGGGGDAMERHEELDTDLEYQIALIPTSQCHTNSPSLLEWKERCLGKGGRPRRLLPGPTYDVAVRRYRIQYRWQF